MLIHRWGLMAALVALASPAAAQVAPLRLGAEQLVVAASGGERVFAFGAPQGETVAAVRGVAGEPVETGTNPECGAGTLDNVDFAGGLRLYFQDAALVGWELGDRGTWRTLEGVGIGTSWLDLNAALANAEAAESSIGYEFLASGYSGLLDQPGGKVTALWAGTTCIFR